MAVTVDSSVADEVLVILETLEGDVDDPAVAPPNTPAEVAVLRIPAEEVRDGLNPVAADEEPKRMAEDEDPVPRLHPSDCE